ncbi:MAG: M36 family metallopeptidase, partial [Pyrinomonadaceae bacterium]
MKLNNKNLLISLKFGQKHMRMAILAVMVLLVPSATFGILNLWDTPQGLPNVDNRVGNLLPTDAQLSRVSNLGARADWNQFGTINTLVKDGGYISTGFTGEPVAAAREWINDNRELFRLSEQSVADLELVSDGRMPYSDAHFVLFRQRFGSVIPTQDGQINVSIVDGNVFHVWSSSAGEQAAPGAATLTPLQAWLAAAANVGRLVPNNNILSIKTDANNNWTLIQVVGYPQVQQVRLTALPTPNNGVRAAYEANVIYVSGHISEAYTVFVDAQTGDVLYRINRVNYLNPSPEIQAPETQVFQGQYQDLPATPACGIRHPFVVPAGKVRLAVTAAAAVPTNDIVLKLYFNNGITDALLLSGDTGTSPETVTYEPVGGVPAGTYKVEVCPYTPPTAPAIPPYNYAGTFTSDDTPVGTGTGTPYPPKWKYFRGNPDLNYSSTDIARTGCWESIVGGVPIPGCEFSLINLAARAPWDYDFRAGGSTFTTRGNAAQTAESWGSPLTPTTPYAPTSSSREYVYPWLNEWKTFGGPTGTGKGCNPNLAHPGDGITTHDADIDRAIVHLFASHNRFHDWSYFLGFTEQNSNMQLDNFGNTSNARQNDPEVGNVQAGAISGGPNGMYLGRDNANQITLQDGTPGITNQYLFQPIAAAFYAPCADGDMDVAIVGHEYTHAISNRMIGGPDAGISGHQGTSMGESWSDLDAAEYLNAFGFVPTNDENPTAVGIYATGNKQLAIRDYAMTNNPLNYSNIGFDTPGPEVHSDGEPWNAVNWAVRQALIDKYNPTYPYTNQARQTACAEGKFNPENCPGNRRWIQLMFDSFLLQPAATSMLNARDAMLAADVARFGGANQIELWRVFGQRGFGELANSNGSDDKAPIPDFSSPLEPNATVTFSVLAQDESNVAITSAKIFVGHYEARSRPIADTDPATTVDTGNPRTNINDNTAKFVPGTYDFVVQAPGYGAHRFTRTFGAGETLNITFSLPTNRASVTKGATVTTTATVAADQTAKNNLIDDTEGTGARLGTVAPVNDDSMTVDLQGTSPVNVTSINVSTAAGPNNGGRFTGIRKFEILASSNGTDFTAVYTSPDDAFPAQRPRPVQPQLIMRSFDIPDTMATHLRLRVVNTQCTGHPGFAGDQDDDPFNNSDCASFVPPTSPGPPPTTPIPPGGVSRATEFQVFTSAPSTSAGFEADVAPRPNGNGMITSADVSQVQGFQLGLDMPYQSNEFQRADCAPFNTKGDGRVSSIDVSQAQAYQLGFDNPPQPAAGPTTPSMIAEPAGSLLSTGNLFKSKSKYNRSAVAAVPREVRVVSTTATAGQNVSVMINVDAMGDESVYGFSLNYDATKLSNPVVTIGTAGGAVSSNTTQPGKIGVSVNGFAGNKIAAGNDQNLVNIQFTVAMNAMTGTTPLTFGDSPTFRETASAPPNVMVLPTTFTDGMVTINAAPTAASVSVGGRLSNQKGRGVANAQITLTNSQGEVRVTRSNSN